MESKQFIEIVNWRKYQERMPDKGASWFKVHCSLANCEAFQSLDYKDQMTLIAIWTFAAESGRSVIKADRRYLFRNCRLLKEEPDLEPLLNAVDDYGRPNPFIRYCDAPVISDPDMRDDERLDRARNSYKKRDASQSKSAGKKARSQAAKSSEDPLYMTAIKTASYDGYVSVRKLQSKLRIGVSRAKLIIETMKENGLLGGYFTGKGYVYKAALLKRNTEKRREEEIREESDSYRNPEEKNREKEEIRNKEAAQVQHRRKKNAQEEAARQKQALLAEQAQDSGRKSVNPHNPMESDESAVITHTLPKPPTSSFRGGPAVPIGRVIRGQFPLHWDSGECEEFGREVIEALGIVADKSNAYSVQEWGAFGHWLVRLKSVCCDSAVVEEIKEYMIDKARWIMSPKCKRKDNPPALLTSIMDGALAKRGIHLPDKRASPA